jgi:hypothetical protein
VHRWLLVVVAGCSFTPPDEAESGEQAPDGGGGPQAVGCREPGTVLCLDFETEIDPMIDSSGFAHQVEAIGVLSRASSVAGGAVDTRAVELDGTSSQLRIPAVPTLDLTAALTMEMWVAPRLPTLPLRKRALLDASNQYRLSITTGFELECAVSAGREGDTTSDALVPADGQWHHVACTWEPTDGGTLKVYVDGQLDDCETDTGTIEERPGDTTIGSRANDAERYDGFLDNVHVYDRALAPAELCRIAGRTGCTEICSNSGSS